MTTKTTTFRKLYTMAEAGALIGRSPATMGNQAAKGVLRAQRVGRAYIVGHRELQRYALEHRRPPIVIEREDPR